MTDENPLQKKIMIYGIIILSSILTFFLEISFFSVNWFYLLLSLIVFSIILIYTKNIKKRETLIIFVSFLIISVSYSFYLSPAIQVSKSHRPILTDNWYDALLWIKNNTEECSTIATYWDPGYFIRSIANRPVVFDGGSQNQKLIIPTTIEDKIELIPYDNNITRIIQYKDSNRTTARIQDIAISMFTSNESLAVDILKEYKVPGCSEMYFFATSDLIGKSVWWSYFSTWNPEKEGEKGNKHFYTPIRLAQTRPIPSQNSIALSYPLNQNSGIVIYETNGKLVPYLQQNNQFLQIEKIVYFNQNLPFREIFNNSQIPGTLWVEHSKQIVILISPELENSIFTKMMLYDGLELEKFELVKSWGGEVKLFRIKLPDEVNLSDN